MYKFIKMIAMDMTSGVVVYVNVKCSFLIQ